MADEEIEYILKENQYKEYQDSKAQIKSLTEDLDKCRGENAQKAQTIQQYQKQMAVKNEEVNFLQQLIDHIGQISPSDKNGLIEIKSTIYESVYEVIEEPEQALKNAAEQQIQAERQKFFQRFEKYLVKVDETNTRLQSQEEMISQQSQLIGANRNVLIADLLKQLQKDCQTKLQTVEVLKVTISESRRNKQQRARLELKLNEKEQEAGRYKQQQVRLELKIKEKEEEGVRFKQQQVKLELKIKEKEEEAGRYKQQRVRLEFKLNEKEQEEEVVRSKSQRLRLELKLKEKEQEVGRLKENVQRLSPLVTQYYKKIQDLHNENKDLRSKLPQ